MCYSLTKIVVTMRVLFAIESVTLVTFSFLVSVRLRPLMEFQRAICNTEPSALEPTEPSVGKARENGRFGTKREGMQAEKYSKCVQSFIRILVQIINWKVPFDQQTVMTLHL